jgi:L-threonylcarbamoyladenylate synthase
MATSHRPAAPAYLLAVRVLAVGDPAAVDVAAAALSAGEPVVLPTETVQGLAVLPSVSGATDRLFALKERPAGLALAVLVADVAQAETVAELGPAVRRLAGRLWPGPLTLVLPRRAGVDLALGGDPATVGVRCPAHDFVLALARRVGPIAATSANRHGQPTPAGAVEAATALGGPVAVVIDGGPCTGAPSTVVDLTGAERRILRAGPVSEADLAAALDRPARETDG